LGVITIEEQHGRFRFTGRLEPTWQAIDSDSGSQRQIACHLRQHLPEALEVVGGTAGCWADPWSENGWAKFVTDSLRHYAQADLCLYKASMLIPALDSGPVTRWDLAHCLSGGLPLSGQAGELIRMQLSGTAIRAICEHSVVGLPRDVDHRIPATFHLPCNTFLHGSGLQVTFNLSRPEGNRVQSLAIGGKSLDLRQRYSVVTSNFLARGYSGFHWFRDGTDRCVIAATDEVIATALAEWWQLSAIDGRLAPAFGMAAPRRLEEHL
jgi:hypothetical protein